MLGYIDKIKEISEKLLKDGKVDMVIGFRKGTVPMMNEPCFAREAADVQHFVWDSNCGINLANYLTDRKEKIGIVAKGCDTRNIVTHIVENKIQRDQLTIIGVPCKGMIDRKKVSAGFEKEITFAEEKNGNLIVKSADAEETLKREDLLQDNCSICIHRNPVIYDALAADLVEEQKDVDRYADVRKVEAMSAQEKWDYFEDLLSPCIAAMPAGTPVRSATVPHALWMNPGRSGWGKHSNPVDSRTFHFLRAFHCAGRCTDCGSCVRACPMNIDVRAFTKKLEKDALDIFGWEAGMNEDERPPLDTFKPDDPNGFIK